MKLAFDTSLLKSLPFGKTLEEISNAGYKFIEIGLAHFSAHESSQEDVRKLLELTSNYGLQIAALIGNYPLSYQNEEIRAFAVQNYLKAIETAETLGCKLFASELNGDIEDRAGSEKAFLKSFEEIRPHLEKSNVIQFRSSSWRLHRVQQISGRSDPEDKLSPAPLSLLCTSQLYSWAERRGDD